MDDHLSKPIDPAVLYATLLRWLPVRRVDLVVEPAVSIDAAAHSDARDRVEAVAGLDMEVGLRHMGGRFDTLARALHIFCNVYRDGVPNLVQTDPVADRDLWLADCHSLRGACLTLGANGLLQRARVLEDALKRDEAADALRQQGRVLASQVLELVDELDRALAPPAMVSSGAGG